MNAKYLTLALLILAPVVLVLPPAITATGPILRPAIGSAGPVQVALQPHAVELGAAQTESRAGLIVQFGEGNYVTRCVSFAADSIAGLELLTRSGLEAALWGGAVCRIQDKGCDFPAQPCFCQCMGSSCQYWSYWHWREDGWAYSQIGSGDYQVQNGDVDAWLWGDAQTLPPALSFAEICRPLEAAPAARSETPTASTQRSKQGVPLAQYAVFLIMAIALIAGFWFLRDRRGDSHP